MTALPIGVPHDLNEMFKLYLPAIKRQLGRYNKVGRNADELEGYVLAWLTQTDVPTKFLASLERRLALPETMTAAEAIDYLGLRWGTNHHAERFSSQWRSMILSATTGRPDKHGVKKPNNALPTPIGWKPGDRGHYSLKAVFYTDDIVVLEESGYFKHRMPIWKQERVAQRATKAYFTAYLTRAIHNAYANWCRTRDRKYKECYLGEMPDGTSWESSLPDTHFGTNDVKQPTQEAAAEVALAVGVIRKHVGDATEDVLKLLADGNTLAEALHAVGTAKAPTVRLLREIAHMREG